MTETHQDALEAGLKGSGLLSRPEHAPLVALLRTLAGQMDAAGADASTRLTAAYLSALKDMRRAVAELPTEKRAAGALARLQASHAAHREAS